MLIGHGLDRCFVLSTHQNADKLNICKSGYLLIALIQLLLTNLLMN